MALLRLFDPTTQFQTKSGALNVAGRLRVFIENTDDLANIYGDDGSRLTQPLILDSNGRARGLFVDSGLSYRLEAYDRNDSLLFTIRRLEPNASGTIINPRLFIKGTPDEIDVEDSVTEKIRTYTVSLSAKVKGKIAENQEAIVKESEARKAALDGKVDKVYTATENHIAVFDNAGNIKDSGKTYADMQGEFKRKQTAKSSPTASGNTLSFIDTVSQDAEGVITATKKSVTVDSTYSSSGTNPVNGKAIKAAIDGLDAAITSNDGTNVQVKVTETNGKISAVNITSDNTENRNNKASSWQTTPDNTHYPTEKLVKDSLDGKVDKVEGKGLSTEDYTTADKTKLDGIAAGTASPRMDGKASVGNSLKYAREDHVHPSDTSKEDKANKTTVVLGTSDSKYPTDKAVAEFVNSSIATNTANYISNNGEPFTSVEQLEAYSGTVTNNDYAFVTGTDSAGNTYYDRYKATVSGSTVTWALEYRLNNSSFTAAQWAAINSGITSDKANYWDGKQDALTFDGTYNGSNNKAATVSSITSRINDLDAAVTSTDGTNVQVKVTQTDGKVTAVNITKDDTASKSDVDNKMDKQTAGNTSTPIYLNNGVAQEVTSIAAATAGALTTPRKIDGVEFNGSGDIVHYGECSTENNVKAKVISCPGFVLTTGARIIIKFTQGNNFRDPTFNVNGTGEVPVKYFGSNLPVPNFLRNGAVYQFVYDGTNYCFVGNFDNNNYVYQSPLSTNNEYPITCKNSANQTAENNFVHFASGITMNPSTKKITASGGFVGNLSGTATATSSGSISAGDDLNSYNKANRNYICNATNASSVSNRPSGATGAFELEVIRGTGDTCVQIYYSMDDVSFNYIRKYTGDNKWTAWNRISLESDAKGIVINEIDGENVICFE